MGKIVPFRRKRPKPKPRRTGRRYGRRGLPFWLPLGMLIGVASGAWVVTELTAPPPRPQTRVTVRTPLPLCSAVNAPNCVIDGDTIRWRGESIRIEGLDAPEVFSPGCAAEKAKGDQATPGYPDRSARGVCDQAPITSFSVPLGRMAASRLAGSGW